MATITETSERTLETSDEIATYLERRHALMGERASFRAGETVSIVSRAGIPPDLGVGDVAIWLFSAGSSAVWSCVLLLTAGGIETIAQVPTDNLAKREAE